MILYDCLFAFAFAWGGDVGQRLSGRSHDWSSRIRSHHSRLLIANEKLNRLPAMCHCCARSSRTASGTCQDDLGWAGSQLLSASSGDVLADRCRRAVRVSSTRSRCGGVQGDSGSMPPLEQIAATAAPVTKGHRRYHCCVQWSARRLETLVTARADGFISLLNG